MDQKRDLLHSVKMDAVAVPAISLLHSTDRMESVLETQDKRPIKDVIILMDPCPPPRYSN